MGSPAVNKGLPDPFRYYMIPGKIQEKAGKIQEKAEKISEKVWNVFKPVFRWKVLYYSMVVVDLYLVGPFVSFEITKIPGNQTQEEVEHKHPRDKWEGVLNKFCYALIALTLISGFSTMCTPYLQVINTLSIRIARLILMFIITKGELLTDGEQIMQWASVYFVVQNFVLVGFSLRKLKNIKSTGYEPWWYVCSPMAMVGMLMVVGTFVVPKDLAQRYHQFEFLMHTGMVTSMMSGTYGVMISYAFFGGKETDEQKEKDRLQQIEDWEDEFFC